MDGQLRRENSFANEQIKFQAFGVKIGIKAEQAIWLEEIYGLLEKLFPYGFETIGEDEIEYHFFVKSKGDKKDNKFELYRNEKKLVESMEEENFFHTLEREVRVTIAEFAVDKVFLHAGVVGWKGKAIVMPAQSYMGKTALVAALVKKGAAYYSDEYAVLDAEGNVQPYPKWLSLRGVINDWTALPSSVESLGGVSGTETVPVGMVLFSKYDKYEKTFGEWQPEQLSRGQGLLEILPHAFPLTNKPKFVLEVLNKLTSRAIIVKTVRGEANEFAETLLNYFESRTA